MKVTQGNIEGEHLVLTGPIQGTVTLEDGTVYDVSPGIIEVAEDHRAEVAHKISLRYYTEGHPSHLELDSESGEQVLRPFDYIPPEGSPDEYHKHVKTAKQAGTPRPEPKKD